MILACVALFIICSCVGSVFWARRSECHIETSRQSQCSAVRATFVIYQQNYNVRRELFRAHSSDKFQLLSWLPRDCKCRHPSSCGSENKLPSMQRRQTSSSMQISKSSHNTKTCKHYTMSSSSFSFCHFYSVQALPKIISKHVCNTLGLCMRQDNWLVWKGQLT